MGASPDPNGDEIRDKIQFSLQGAADMASITIAVAVGLFGILSLFVMMQTTDKAAQFGRLWWYDDLWKLLVFIVLTAAYFGVSLLGLTCFVYRRQYENMTNYYFKKRYPGYNADFRDIAKRNPLTDFVTIRLNPRFQNEKRKYRRVWPDFVAFVIIAILLWVFIGLF